ncbi:MAG: DNA primase [bacterium]|nr:DNA primase [bacterium]
MSDNTQQIKDKLDIADFIRVYVPLNPAGKNLKGHCPFHKEKSPSFIVSPDRQMWHCFGCNVGGDIFAFLMRFENIEFFEALKILAEKTGVDIGQISGPDQKALNVLYEANRLAKDFFKSQLTPAVREYLKSRGLKPETIAEFEIGFAPDQPEVLTRFLLGKGYAITAIEKAGLSLKTDRGTFRDRFRNRIMFPLINSFGKTIAFTGRIMPGFESENLGKYVNSPETPIFNKSKLLYGLDKSKNFIRDSRTAVLVEGQMDLIMSWQDGVKNLVATSGTALTVDHLRNLKRLSDSLVLSFDQDAAGKMAAERTIDLANAADFSIKVLSVPADLGVKDPADIAQANPGMMVKLVSEAKPAMEYLISQHQISNRSDTLVWKKNVRALLSRLRVIASPVERSHWLKIISDQSGVAQTTLEEEMLNIKDEAPKFTDSAVEPAEKAKLPQLSRKDLISQRTISLVLNHPAFYEDIKNNIEHIPESYRAILEHGRDPKSLSLNVELKPVADLVSLRSGLDFESDEVKAKAELLELVRQLKMENLRSHKQELLWSIKLAEQKNNEAELTAALSAFDKVLQEMQNLEKQATLA